MKSLGLSQCKTKVTCVQHITIWSLEEEPTCRVKETNINQGGTFHTQLLHDRTRAVTSRQQSDSEAE